MAKAIHFVLLVCTIKSSLGSENDHRWMDDAKRGSGKSCFLDANGEELEIKPAVKTENTPSFESLPDKIDWKEQGMVTLPKQQGACLDCYNFAAVGAIESANAIAGYPLTNLSEQQYLDCFKHNCKGGWPTDVMEYARQNGLMSFSDYPYHPEKIGDCKYDESKVVARVFNHSVYKHIHENEIVQLLAKGPVTAYIVIENFKKIKPGHVFKGPCKEGRAHAVEIVAFYKNSTEGPYWIIKNSWGNTWDADGYAMFQYDKDLCHITTQVSQPIVKPKEKF